MNPFNIFRNPRERMRSNTNDNSKKCKSVFEHIVFIDYDDTLFCSTYFLSNLDIQDTEPKMKENKRSYKVTAKWNKPNKAQMDEFISNLEKVGNATYKFLYKIILKFTSSNVKIVTNSCNDWVHISLSIARDFCEIFRKIQMLLKKYKIEIIYARNHNIHRDQWKTICFDKLLRKYFSAANASKNKKVNIITIGDQWQDHKSIEGTRWFRIMHNLIIHHKIKLVKEPDCTYLRIELNYISTLFDEGILFGFKNGLVLQFDGYDDTK